MPQDRDILQQSFIDAEALEMIRSYHLEPNVHYEFVKRQDDYYITLIGAMCHYLEELYDVNRELSKEEIINELLNVAKGLLVYSDNNTKEEFKDVNQAENALYVAAIYYVCQYEAIASLILSKLTVRQFVHSEAARKIYYIIRAPKTEKLYPVYQKEIVFLDAFLETGNEQYIDEEIAELERLTENDGFKSMDEFFNAQILLTVLKKFKEHNLRTMLYAHDSSIDWTPYIKHSREDKQILSFLPSQEDAIKKGLLTFDRSFCLGMSTSAGKSYITELIVFQEIQKNPQAKIIYLAPLRSLSRELTAHYRKVSTRLGYKMRCTYGGHINEMEDASMEVAQLIIATPEAFTSIDVDFADISLVICDEGQLIDDESRGVDYELLLTRLRRYEHMRFLFLSAIIPNLDDVNTWIGGTENQVEVGNYRPCQQRIGGIRYDREQYVVDIYDKDSDYTQTNYTIALKGWNEGEVNRHGQCALVAHNAKHAGVVMVFAYMKMRCNQIAKYFLKDADQRYLADANYSEFGRNVIEYCAYQLGEDFRLVKLLRKGMSYHHGDLPQDIREYIERLLEAGEIRIVLCTSTLAEGVNFPIKTLVLAYIDNHDEKRNKQYKVKAEKIKNIIGRVGRAGRETYGTIVVMDPSFMGEVRLAMSNNIERKMRGTLYRELKLDKPRYTKWRNEEKIVSAIDFTITKNKGQEEFDTANIQSIAEGSFAYKFCKNEQEKERLVSIFTERYEILRTFFADSSYDSYRHSGLSIAEIGRLLPLLDEGLIGDLRECRMVDIPDMMARLICIVKDLRLPGDIEKEKTRKPMVFTHENLVHVADSWIRGNTYVAMANRYGIEVDDTIEIVNKLSTMYAFKIQSILTYLIESYDIQNNAVLDNIPRFLQCGVNDEFMLFLMLQRLADRMAVHVMKRIVDEREWWDKNDNEILEAILLSSNGVLEEIKAKDIPTMTKVIISDWFDRKKRLFI